MMTEDGERDNEDLYLLWGVLFLLYVLGTAIALLGIGVVLLIALAAAGVWAGVVAYMASEARRYRLARSDLRRLDRWMQRQLRKYR